jgi:hypothetical protein
VLSSHYSREVAQAFDFWTLADSCKEFYSAPVHPLLRSPLQCFSVVTSYGLREIVGNNLATGRIAKWALGLMGLDITYIPQTASKSQDLADFVAEWTETQ